MVSRASPLMGRTDQDDGHHPTAFAVKLGSSRYSGSKLCTREVDPKCPRTPTNERRPLLGHQAHDSGAQGPRLSTSRGLSFYTARHTPSEAMDGRSHTHSAAAP